MKLKRNDYNYKLASTILSEIGEKTLMSLLDMEYDIPITQEHRFSFHHC